MDIGLRVEYDGKKNVVLAGCQTAHCGRCKPHADFGENTSPIEPYRYRPQNYSGMTADCRSFI